MFSKDLFGNATQRDAVFAAIAFSTNNIDADGWFIYGGIFSL
jgi:hypothetical protein